MGQQQLLLIILGVLVVGVAVVVGMTLFSTSSIDSKRNNVVNECINLASLAQKHYLKPTSIGGGSQSFTGWSIPTELSATKNGTYSAVVDSVHVVITGIGSELVTANTPVEVKTTVYADTYMIEIVH